MDKNPYEHPELYEIAFSWRDYGKAIDFITEAAKAAGLTKINSMVELGCGPGQYCREFARRGVTAYGVDSSPYMALYAQAIYDKENLPGYILEADFRDFRLERPADLAVCMMATFTCLLTNRDILDHLNSVARNLVAGGIYLIELSHPRDIFCAGKSTQDAWDIEKDGVKLSIAWATDSVLDPITETDRGTVRYTVDKSGAIQQYSTPDQGRRLSLGLMRALVDLCGEFELAHIYGDIDVNQPFDNTKKSWRMVMVLRKRAL